VCVCVCVMVCVCVCVCACVCVDEYWSRDYHPVVTSFLLLCTCVCLRVCVLLSNITAGLRVGNVKVYCTHPSLLVFCYITGISPHYMYFERHGGLAFG